jgi:spermidine synthase
MYETIWLRRVALLVGSSAFASALTIGAFMTGLAVGALLVRRVRLRPGYIWAGAECLAAVWALAAPWLHALAWQAVLAVPAVGYPLVALVVALPAVPLGATWPAVARAFDGEDAAWLYATNTAGAVVGVLGAGLVVLPALGMRGTEIVAAILGLALAWAVSELDGAPRRPATATASRAAMVAVVVSGFVSLGLEVLWFRLAAVAFGGTVQVHVVVLATFLAMVALGAAVGRRWPRADGVAHGLAALGLCAVGGAWLWGQLPFVTAALYSLGGERALLPGTALMAVGLMGAAPVASGVVFSAAVRLEESRLDEAAGSLYAANTFAGIAGAWGVSLVLLPWLQPGGTVAAMTVLCGLGAVVVGGRKAGAATIVAALALPSWDAKLHAVGVHLRIHEFADTSVAAVRRFADEGWELRSYEHGRTGAVAVGRSTRTGNVWMSIDGKVDASTGDDMPTQELSGLLPVRMADDRADVLVVGLASGVTAGAVLAEPGVERLVVVELEEAVVAASHHFDHVNGRPLEDPRTTLVVDDARAWLSRTDERFDVIVSEPSNPWISGVSNLFTREYWELARSRLREGGVMCQWVQLYGLSPEAFRGLVRTYTSVFPDVWLFETIAGSDALLIGGVGTLPDDLPLAPTLDPRQVRRLGGPGWRNTDDRPRVEWEAPRWLHRSTGRLNRALIEEAAQ